MTLNVVKEQIGITGDKWNTVPRPYLNMEVAIFWVVAPVCFCENVISFFSLHSYAQKTY